MQLTRQRYSTSLARLLLGAVTVLGIPLASPVSAQEAAEQQTTPEGDGAEEAVEGATDEESLRPMIDLGKFKIHDLRPTRNVTTKVTFSMHLALNSKLSKQQVTQLEHWQHRVRDQVIIAIRTLQVKDFQEPDLNRLRRKTLIRVNRLFRAKLAEEILLTEYLFQTN